jgi:hypothetical protein
MAYALVAQLDRVSDYESEGRGFESLRAHQKTRIGHRPVLVFLSAVRREPRRSPVDGSAETCFVSLCRGTRNAGKSEHYPSPSGRTKENRIR